WGWLAETEGGDVGVMDRPPTTARGQTQKRVPRRAADQKKRMGAPAMGGSTRAPIMTAYRQQALACASALSGGPQRVRDLRNHIPDAGKILLHNVYGWFDRAERGIYVLTDAGHAGWKRWPQHGVGLTGAAAPAE